jgi:hypothetical protein
MAFFEQWRFPPGMFLVGFFGGEFHEKKIASPVCTKEDQKLLVLL